jgi:hypothetical protein
MSTPEQSVIDDFLALGVAFGAKKTFGFMKPNGLLDVLKGVKAAPVWLVKVADLVHTSLTTPLAKSFVMGKVSEWQIRKGHTDDTVKSVIGKLAPHLGYEIDLEQPLEEILPNILQMASQRIVEKNSFENAIDVSAEIPQLPEIVRCPACSQPFMPGMGN